GQMALFVDQGKIADAFPPGRHQLTTSNLPVLSRLRGWKYGFESPFKAEIIFVNTKQFTNRQWGTSNPVIVRDPEFGPVRLRASVPAVRPRAHAARRRERVAAAGSRSGHRSAVEDGCRRQPRPIREAAERRRVAGRGAESEWRRRGGSGNRDGRGDGAAGDEP